MMTAPLFPFHSEIFDSFSEEDILNRLSSMITEERDLRMDQVIAGRTNHFVPIMENIYDRGNISAAMRSAEAFGFLNFNIVENKNQKFKSANRVTQGADKWLNVTDYDKPEDCVKNLKSDGFQIFCTHLEASRPISEIDFTEPTALVFGNEKDGVSKEMVRLSDGNVIIPMIGFSQSFNISVAAAISFYHVYLERVRHLQKNGDLTDAEKMKLKAHYVIQTLGLERSRAILTRA